MSNQASWQSAFWALVPIALNSMCQPCGKILGLPSKYGFYLNSSPILCVTNALELIFKLLWRSCSTRSVKAAASLTANEIFEDVESSGHHDGLAQLKEIWQVRVIVFALGTIPQVIKLYATTGIPGTKVCASLYLGSFFAIELIMIWLKCYRSSLPLNRRNNRGSRSVFYEFLRTLAFFATISFSSVAFVGTAFKPMAGLDLSYAGVLVNWAAVGLTLQPLFHRGVSRRSYILVNVPGKGRKLLSLFHRRSLLVESHSIFYPSLLMSALFGGLVYAIPGKWATLRDLDTPLINLFQDWERGPANAIFLPVHPLYLLLIFFLFGSTHFLGTREAFRTRPKIQHCASIAVMLLHFLAGILLYAFRYDPQGTYKPNWTSNLG